MDSKSTVTYRYNCGHELTVDVMDVLLLRQEPTYVCPECYGMNEPVISKIFIDKDDCGKPMLEDVYIERGE